MSGIVKKVSVKDDGHHNPMPKNVTMRYNFEELKKVRDFDEWVDEKLEDLARGSDLSLEIDFETVGSLPEVDREPYLKSLLKGVADHRKRDKFIMEYLSRAAKVSVVLSHVAEGLPRSPNPPAGKGESSKKSKKKESGAAPGSPKSGKKSGSSSKSSKSSKSSSKDKKSKK